ncbi:helix-turn-helix domain-containing protein [Rhodococcus sp. NPDC057529]|uniref:helix-turn-helix domain-containing protein n=1 Tax=Rhodococcus sp. NPDC057529 TaxID=3346158 RepID=UPI00366A66BE
MRAGTPGKSSSGGRRDLEALRDRRMRAAETVATGRRQVDVAVELDASQQTASRWYRRWTEGDDRAAEHQGAPGFTSHASLRMRQSSTPSNKFGAT